MEENSKLRSSKVSCRGKTPNHRLPLGARTKKVVEKMTGHLNHPSAVIENKCGARLTILKHNPISVLVGQTGPGLFRLLTRLLLLCLSTRPSRSRGGSELL